MGCTNSSSIKKKEAEIKKDVIDLSTKTLPLPDPKLQSIGRNGSDIDLTQHDLQTAGKITKKNNSSEILDLTQHSVPGEHDYIENILNGELNELVLPPAVI
mmetsp:Transcript_10507/g.15797  ORF Transcript_10507/g.15797 Transcript_10507/m.15797 type:complete len:101 (+) Transcript_10507:195-497(+)